MSLKKIEQVKKDKGFKLFDLIIYGVVAVLVAVLFIVVFTTRDASPLTGVRIYLRAEIVFEYEFDKPLPEELHECVEVKEDGDGITVTITSGGDTNVVYIDTDKGTVVMKEANCNGKQCVYFPKIDNNSKFIFCSPHGVKVEPFSRDLDSPDLII
ncbi:MAG: NusG domain II-containing protein [Clostridia bacterium]|nr:NusG domain II-containing protein [Clostridia bacterium]